MVHILRCVPWIEHIHEVDMEQRGLLIRCFEGLTYCAQMYV